LDVLGQPYRANRVRRGDSACTVHRTPSKLNIGLTEAVVVVKLVAASGSVAFEFEFPSASVRLGSKSLLVLALPKKFKSRRVGYVVMIGLTTSGRRASAFELCPLLKEGMRLRHYYQRNRDKEPSHVFLLWTLVQNAVPHSEWLQRYEELIDG